MFLDFSLRVEGQGVWGSKVVVEFLSLRKSGRKTKKRRQVLFFVLNLFKDGRGEW